MKYRSLGLVLCLASFLIFGPNLINAQDASENDLFDEQEMSQESEDQEAIEDIFYEQEDPEEEEFEEEEYEEEPAIRSRSSKSYSSAVSEETIQDLQLLVEKLMREYANLSSLIDRFDSDYSNMKKVVLENSNIIDELVSEEKLYSRGKDGKKEVQYVKLKAMDEFGQEMEIVVDPNYVDMDIDLPIKKVSRDLTERTTKGIGKDKEQDERIKSPKMDRIIDYVKESMEKIGRERKTKKIVRKKNGEKIEVEEKDILSQDVVNEMLKAQKLYYSMKYLEALNAVQRSLSKQKTAVGLALEGSIFYTLGNIDFAIDSWKEALDLNPEMDEVKFALYKCRKLKKGKK